MPSASITPTACRSRCAGSATRGVGRAAFAPISWDAALDEVAEGLTRAAQRHGAQAVWPYYYSGTMGLVQRDGINRLRHAMGYSREDLTICSMLTATGWRRRGRGAARRRRPRDGQIRSDRRLGRQPGFDPNQCDDPCRERPARARRETRRHRPLPHRQRRGRRFASGAAARHRRGARLRGHARAVQGGLRRPRSTWRATPTTPPASKRIWRPATRPGRRRSPGLSEDADRRFRPALRAHQAQLYPRRLRFLALAQRLGAAVRGDLPADRDRRVAT